MVYNIVVSTTHPRVENIHEMTVRVHISWNGTATTAMVQQEIVHTYTNITYIRTYIFPKPLTTYLCIVNYYFRVVVVDM